MGAMYRVGTSGGLLYSVDSGETWAEWDTDPGFGALSVINGVAYNQLFYTIGIGNTNKARRHEGEGWSALSPGMDTTRDITGIDAGYSTFVIAGSASTTNSVLLKSSTNNGSSWTTRTTTGATRPVHAVQQIGTEIWCMLSGAGIHKSVDDGVNWTGPVNPFSSGVPVRVASRSSVVVVVGVAAGVGLKCAKSTDTGASWTEFTLDSTSEGRPAVATNGWGAWAIASGSKIFRSTDNGVTWIERTLAGVDAGTAWAGMECWGGDWVLSPSSSAANVWRSTDNGQTWAEVSGSSAGFTVVATGHVKAEVLRASEPTLNPDDPPEPPPPKIWLAGGYAAGEGTLHRSEDNGETWDELDLGAEFTGVWAVASDDLGRWVLACFGNRLFRSIDNGETWAQINPKLPTDSPARCIAAGSAGVWIAGGDGGTLSRSTDHGQTWNPVAHGLSGAIGTPRIQGIATDRAGVWVAITSNYYILRSTDNGATWAQSLPAGYSGYGWIGVGTDREGEWWIAGDVPDDLLTSADNGATWSIQPGFFSSASSSMTYAVETDRAGTWLITSDTNAHRMSVENIGFETTWYSQAYSNIRSAATDTEGVWLAAGEVGGPGPTSLVAGTLRRSINNGVSFSTVSGISATAVAYGVFAEDLPIDPPPDPDPDPDPGSGDPPWFAVGAAGKLARSTDSGITWALIDAGFEDAAIFAVRAVADVVVAVGEDGQMRRSDDAGLTWGVIDPGFGADHIRGLTTNSAGAWVAVGDAGKIRYSADNGLTWSAGIGLDGSFALTAVDTNGAGAWVAVGELGDIVRSTNNGASWVAITTGGDDLRAVAADGSICVAVGDTGRISRSTNSGVTWAPVSGATQFMRAVFVSGETWIASGWFGELLRSTDAGATWILIDAGFGSEVGSSFIGAVAGDGDIWFAASDESLVMRRSADDGLTWESVTSEFDGDAVHAITPTAPWSGAVDQTAQFDVTIPIFASSGALIDWSALVADETVERYSAQLIDPAGIGETLNLRISSWQGTIQAVRASYLQCVVPAADGLLESLVERSDWVLSVSRLAKIGGIDFAQEMARVPLGQIQYSKGPSRATVTLSGYATELSFPDFGSRTLTGIRMISSGSSMRVRTGIDWALMPGMTAIADGVPVVARYINYYVSTSESYMDVGDRPGG